MLCPYLMFLSPGGAAVTEEIVPGYKFSRASYVLSLLRPQIFTDLELKKHGLKVVMNKINIQVCRLINAILKVYLRDPSNYTPIRPEWVQPGKPSSLLLGMCEKMNKENISKFSKKDAIAYQEYEHELEQFVKAVDPLLDAAAVDVR